MFVAFMDISCPRIYIPKNVYTSICLIPIKMIPNFLPKKYVPKNQENFCSPWTLTPQKIKMIPQYIVTFSINNKATEEFILHKCKDVIN